MNCTIERADKDSLHPFVMISRKLIDDRQVSYGLRFLIITCLSKPPTWKYNVKDMANSLDVSDDIVYKYLNEGIAKGYIFREQGKHKGKFGNTIYKIFEEKQEIQIILPLPRKPDTVQPDTVLAVLSNNDTLVNNKYIERTQQAAGVQNDVSLKSKATISKKFNEETKLRPTKILRDIPSFLKIPGLSERDQQILANQFTDSQLSRALEDCKSYTKKKTIDNLAAMLTNRCKSYKMAKPLESPSTGKTERRATMAPAKQFKSSTKTISMAELYPAVNKPSPIEEPEEYEHKGFKWTNPNKLKNRANAT